MSVVWVVEPTDTNPNIASQVSLEFHGSRGTPRHKGHPDSLGLLVSYDCVVGSSAQAIGMQHDKKRKRSVLILTGEK